MTILVHSYDNTSTGRTDIPIFGQRVAFSAVEERGEGVGVGEFRARRVDDHYLLDCVMGVIDPRDRSFGREETDTRSYKVLGIMKLSEKTKAKEFLYKRALSYANDLNKIIGCGVTDLNKKDPKKR